MSARKNYILTALIIAGWSKNDAERIYAAVAGGDCRACPSAECLGGDPAYREWLDAHPDDRAVSKPRQPRHAAAPDAWEAIDQIEAAMAGKSPATVTAAVLAYLRADGDPAPAAGLFSAPAPSQQA